MTTRLVIVFEPRAGVDTIRALRRLLKFAGRSLGLRAISAQEHVIAADKAETAASVSSTTPQPEEIRP